MVYTNLVPKYQILLVQIVKPQFQKHSFNWLPQLTKSDKQGLRIIEKIVKYKGEKRFVKHKEIEEDGVISLFETLEKLHGTFPQYVT
jgi:hypothetical protein